MKTAQRIFTVLLVPLALTFLSCTEEMPNVTGKNQLYELRSVSDQDIEGHVKIRERFDGSTQLELVLRNTNPNQTYSAYVHFNNALEGGAVALTLTPVDGTSKNSVTEIRNLDSGSLITYDEWLEFDGHVVIQSDQDNGIAVAQADIGENALTGRFQQFLLYEGDVAGVEGLMTIEERVNGYSLVTIQMEGTTPGKQHPVTLNFGSIHGESGMAGKLNSIDGSTGIGRTDVERLDDNLPTTYEALIDFRGFARIHLGEGTEMNTVLAHGNIAYVEN